MENMIYCNVLLCPLEKECARKSYLGKSYDENIPLQSFATSLIYDKEVDDWSCEDGITKD